MSTIHNITSVAERVKASIATLSPELQRAARWVDSHPTELSVQSMRRSAIAAGVLPVTMTRLARALGYRGFEEMRHSLREGLVRSAGENFSLRAQRQQEHQVEPGGEVDALVQAQIQNITSVQRRNKVNAIELAADTILQARSVVFLGMRASYGIAFHLHYCCQLLRPNTSLASNQAGTVNDQIWRLHPEDLLVVVGLAPYSRQTVELAQQARSQGAGVLALTDSDLGPLGRSASQALIVEADSPAFFHSMTGALAMTEALVSMIVLRGGASVTGHLAENEKRLKNMQAYWERRPSQD